MKDPADIKRLRKALSRTQVGLAKILGSTGLTISRWERGECVPMGVYQEKLDKLQAFVDSKRGGE